MLWLFVYACIFTRQSLGGGGRLFGKCPRTARPKYVADRPARRAHPFGVHELTLKPSKPQNLPPINWALCSLTVCPHFVDVLWAFRKPRAGALGSLTECPLDIRPLLWSPKPWRRQRGS
jgi:hypothetical protein